jgi:hypothetical protein
MLKLILSTLLCVLVTSHGQWALADDASPTVDELPSWQGASKTAITDFVTAVTTSGSPSFVPESERIAVFDNDGTLWCEKPYYAQLAFAFARVKEMAPSHPEFKQQPILNAVITGDTNTLLKSGSKGVLEVIGATHAGMTSEQFAPIVEKWIATAKHPKFHKPYTQLVYRPMLEVLAYLRNHGFKTWIVSGGGVDFMRPWTEHVYGVPPEQVVGSRCKLKYEYADGKGSLRRLPEVDFIDDGEGKPVGIHTQIGLRPIAAFGNSDGDLEMLQYTTTGTGNRLGVLIHHTDAAREYAYDRTSSVGHLDKALDIAPSQGWTVVDMKNEWKEIFPW